MSDSNSPDSRKKFTSMKVQISSGQAKLNLPDGEKSSLLLIFAEIVERCGEELLQDIAGGLLSTGHVHLVIELLSDEATEVDNATQFLH